MKQSLINKLALCACATLLAAGVAWSDHKKGHLSTKVTAEAQGDQKLCHTSKLIGSTVYDSKGETLGKVHDLVFNPSSGRLEFGLLSLNVEGHQGHIAAVPWQMLEPKDQGSFTLTADREKFLSAKMWNSAAEVDISEPDFARRTYTYYGLNWDDRMSVGGRVIMPGGIERGESDRYQGSIEYDEDKGLCFPRPQPDGKETFPFLHREYKEYNEYNN